jgi:coenzyme PQQ biosynthesis protein PqqD
VDLNASPRLAGHLRVEALDVRVLVYDPNGGMIVELNRTGGLVIQLCDGVRTVAEIRDALADAYPPSAEEIGEDVPRVIEGLVERGVLECP